MAVKALTLRRPWADCVALFGKDIENREWAAPPWLVGQDLAIHSGKGWLEIVDRNVDLFTFDRGGIYVSMYQYETTVSAIVAVVTVGASVRESDSPWFFGTWGWPLQNIRALPTSVPCRGAQGLWDLPENVDAEVRRQLAVLAETGDD